MKPAYAELHCHSHFSFKEGASSVEQLVAKAKELDYQALALTDHDNLSGVMRFSRAARSLDLHSIIGAELTLKDGYHLTLLAQDSEGYSNLSRLLSFSHVLADERTDPKLDKRFLAEHSKGLIALSGCRQGEIARLVRKGDLNGAEKSARNYREWFGPENFFIELQQNLAKGDTLRNKEMVFLADELGLPVVATNNVHYHVRRYSHLHDCLMAIQKNKTLEEIQHQLRPSREHYLKSSEEMARLFWDLPEAISNTLSIAERCSFDLTRDLRYRFPDYDPPNGYTSESYLRKLCEEAAVRRYGSLSMTIKNRLDQEFRLINKHHLAGFLLHYHDIVQLARRVMIKLGLSDTDTPLEERPPGRGRGSSVAMLVGYLIGLSHIDPMQYNLSLDRFLTDDLLGTALDIDLDFPRNIREQLILAVHKEWGWDRAALTGAHSTYKIKGAIRDLGKVLGLFQSQVDHLAKSVDHASAKELIREMERLPGFKGRVDSHGWRDLVRLAAQLDGTPRYIFQHSGGMIISSKPLIDTVPVQKGAIDGRYICQWDKDDIDAAGMVKIDFLALGALSQLQEVLHLIEARTGKSIDISRINFEDIKVYDMLCSGDTVGIFQVESAAQMQTITRLRPRNLVDMAFEVACVRPGVGVHDGVRHFISRRNGLEPVTFDHPLERRALERTLGVILFQDQMNELAMDVGGLSSSEADQLRRSFGAKYDSTEIIKAYWEKFRDGAVERSVDEKTITKVFLKLNGYYMFPESHAYAFGTTAYQLSWLKCYYPLEFMTALFNQQPMGFWGLETLKQDTNKHGIEVLNPDINRSKEKCLIENGSIRLGLCNVANIGEAASKIVVNEHESQGDYKSLRNFMERSGLGRKELENLVGSGALDFLRRDRRELLWEVGLSYVPVGKQVPLRLPTDQDMVSLKSTSDWEIMTQEYQTLSLYTKGHFMEKLRPHLTGDVVRSKDLENFDDGERVKVAGLVARPLQHPLAEAYFISLEDEYGFIPLIIWPSVYESYKMEFREHLMIVDGTVSRRECTLNIVVDTVDIPKIRLRDSKNATRMFKPPRSIFR